MNKLAKEYAPVTGYLENTSPYRHDLRDYYVAHIETTNLAKIKVLIGLSVAYKAVRLKTSKVKSFAPIRAFNVLVRNNRIFANGNGAFVNVKENTYTVDGIPVKADYHPVIIIDPRTHRFIKKKVKLPKADLPFNHCPKCRIRMKRLDTADGDPEGSRNDSQCSRCGDVYGCTKASQSLLRTKKQQIEHLKYQD